MPSTRPTEPRRCDCCGEVQPEAEFITFDGTNSAGTGRRNRFCARCRKTKVKAGVTTPVKYNTPVKCTRCGLSKHPDEFLPKGRKPGSSGLRFTCNECMNTSRVNKTRFERKTRERHKKREPDPVQEELARRALQRKSLLNFVAAQSPAPGGYKAGWVHKLVCAKLEKFMRDIEAGKSPRLMLFLPPRSGKSELASKMFPCWFLGHHPDLEIIACSYSSALPLDFSRKMKDVMADPRYKTLFPRTILHKDARAAENWRLTRGGAYVAAGVSGPITGKGAHCMIIDDPVKDAEEADSETIRKKAYDWYGSTARTRLAPGAGILFIMTRWHDDDLAGRILREERELKAQLDKDNAPEEAYEALENWDVVDLKALAESDEFWDQQEGRIIYRKPEDDRPHIVLRREGEALHPERFDKVSLLKLKNSLQPRHWSALYQQNPTPDEGDTFTRAMLRYHAHLPDPTHLDIYCAWDLAIGMRQSNDFTVGIIGGLDHHGDLHLLDMIRGRMKQQAIAEAIVSRALKYLAIQTGIERGQLELALRPTLDEEMRRKQPITLAEGKEALVPVTDKLARARPLQGMMQQGRVWLPLDQPWTEILVGELLRFPNGVYDDCVDALAWLARMVLRKQPPVPPVQKLYANKPESWKDRLKGARKKNWLAA